MFPSFRSCLHRAALGALALISAALPARAQTRTVQEGVPASNWTVYVDTVNKRVSIATGTYRGSVPSVAEFVNGNIVIATTTTPGYGCTIYSTGSIMCLGVKLSTSDPAGVYVPYSGATADVNLGTHKLLAGQIGAGTSPSTNFMFDGLGTSGGYVRIGAGTNQATGYYWGGTRGYSMQQRYDLTGTPFTLHDELNNVDRFYLDTSGAWYFPVGVTFSSGTSLGAFKAASFLGVSGATETVDSTMGGVGTVAAPLGVNFSTITTALAGKLGATAAAGGSLSGNYPNPGIAAGVIGASQLASGLGITSSCASGFHISTDTYVNGILTGGSCVADGSGGGGSSTMTITAVSDNFLGSVTGSQKTFTLSQTPANAAALSCYLDGLLLSQTSDYIYTPPMTLAITTAPAANSTGFFCNYFVNTSTLPAVAVYSATGTFSAPQTIPNVVSFLSSQTFTAASSFSFGLAAPIAGSSPTINCELTFTQNASIGQPRLSFNGDSTSAHYSCFGYWQGAGGAGGFNCANGFVIALESNLTNTTKSFSGAFHYLALPAAVSVNLQFTSGSTDSGNNYDGQWGSGQWTSGSYPTTGTITASAGTMTGTIRCTYLNY